MTFDFKNILIGIIIGVLGTIVVGCFLNDIYIDVRVGDIEELSTKLNKLASLDLKLDQQSFLSRFDWGNIAETTESIAGLIVQAKK